MVQPHL